MRSASLNGLLSTLSAPAARKRSRSLDMECALAMTIGIVGISALILRIASSPSMPGIATSIRIIAGRWLNAMSTACRPSAAIKTGYPAFSSTRLHRRCATSLSSATSTLKSPFPPAFASGMPELQGPGAFRGQGNREMEGRAVPDRAFHPDLAPVHLHDLPNDREAEAGPGNRLRGTAADTAETLEHVTDLVLWDADAGVGDAHQGELPLDPARKRDRPTLGRVLDRVVDHDAEELALGAVDLLEVDVGIALRLERLRQLVRGLAHRGDVLDHHQHMLGPAARVGDGRRGQLQPQPLAGARRRADLDA